MKTNKQTPIYRHVSKLFHTIILGSILSLTSTAFTSCDSDENSPTKEITVETKTNGKPSKIGIKLSQTDNYSTYYFYDGDKRSKEIAGNSTFIYEYKGDDLSKLSTLNSDDKINKSVSFNRDDKTITEDSSNDPFYSHIISQIDLNNEGLPTQYKYVKNQTIIGDKTEESVTTQGRYYMVNTFDNLSRLTRQDVYALDTDKLTQTIAFTYEETPGIMSKSGLPTWVNLYKINNTPNTPIPRSVYRDVSDIFLYLCYVNNVSSMKFSYFGAESTDTYEITYTYKYNVDGYPISATENNPRATSRTFEITY